MKQNVELKVKLAILGFVLTLKSETLPVTPLENDVGILTNGTEV